KEKESALKNMKALPPRYADALRYAKANNLKRFAANPRSELLSDMCGAFLLQRDNPSAHLNAALGYFVVPNYVWNAIDNIEARPIPQTAPWAQASGLTWMSR